MFQKIVNFWFSSFVTERLLASPLFNRMAAKTHHHVSNITDKGMKKVVAVLFPQFFCKAKLFIYV